MAIFNLDYNALTKINHYGTCMDCNHRIYSLPQPRLDYLFLQRKFPSRQVRYWVIQSLYINKF